MDRGKITSTGRGGKSKAPQHPQDIFALGSKSTVVVSRDSEKRNIHKPSTSGVERKRESSFVTQPPSKRPRLDSPGDSVTGTSLDIDPVDLVSNVLQALDTHNSDKLLGLLTGSIRLLKSQRSKPDPILCMSMLYLCKIRPNMFAHETITQSLCTLLRREQGAAFKSKGNPLVFILACNMLYAGHRDSNSWPDTFIKVYIEDALNERWWVDCSWCKCLVDNIVTAFNTKQPPSHLIPSDNVLGTMSPSGSPRTGTNDDESEGPDLDYQVFARYSSSYEQVEAMVLEAIKEQLQRRAAPDAIGKGFLKLLATTCGFPEIRVISASRLEAWLHSGKLWRSAQELLAYVCCNADACGSTAQRDHEVLAQLARMRLKTKQLQAAYQSCLREMVSDSPALLRSVVTHTIYNELSNVRSPNNMAVLAALVQAQPQLVPAAMADTYQELLLRPEDYLRPLRALTRECVRAARADVAALLPLARCLASPTTPPAQPPPPTEIRERAFTSIADLFCLCCLVTASHSKHLPEYKQQICLIQVAALGWLLDTVMPIYRPSRHDYQHVLNKIMFVESAETYSKTDNWPPESERALTYRLCCEAPLPQNTLLRVIFIGLSKEIPVAPGEVFELVEQLVRRACALPSEDNPLQVDQLEVGEYLFQLCQFTPPDNITLPTGYTPPALAITSLYWRAWLLLTMLAAHNPSDFASRAASTYPTLRALIEMCITNKPSIEWNNSSAETERAEAERAAILQLESHLAAASNAKLPVTEHNSRLLTQLTIMDPLGAARKPPQSIIEQLQQLSSQLRLGKLLCRQPALLLELVERHGTKRAMPWLHQLLKHDRLELSVLPVQCLCEFLSAGGAGGTGESGKAGELAAHLRRTVRDTEEGARAVLQYYTQRLAHTQAATRAGAGRGLKLVLSQAEDIVDMDYSADVSPEEWLELLWDLEHWDAVKHEVVTRIRAACLVECIPSHVAAYVQFLSKHVASTPDADHTDVILDLSQVVMERVTVSSAMLPPAELRTPPPLPNHMHHQTLHALHHMFYTHLRQVRVLDVKNDEAEGADGESGWGPGERVELQWGSGWHCTLHVLIAHAHLKLLCYGPSLYDTEQEIYSWLQSAWVGTDAPTAFLLESAEEAVLLPDWLRLTLVRSARPTLLAAGLRALPAHKLALFIQTFGMPVTAMSALLSALDACPAGAVVRLGVERSYMTQLLQVQRARGATGGEAFAHTLQLQPTDYPPDDNLFAEEELPEETEDTWNLTPAVSVVPVASVPTLLATAFGDYPTYCGDVDTGVTQLLAAVAEEVKTTKSGRVMSNLHPYTCKVIEYLQGCNSAVGLLRHPTYSVPLLRLLRPLRNEQLSRCAARLMLLTKCPMPDGPVTKLLETMAAGLKLRADNKTEDVLNIQPDTDKQHLITALESSTPSNLEALGQRLIETQNTQLAVEVISQLLENNQRGLYEYQLKCEDGSTGPVHMFGEGGLGCGLLLDWLSELQHETVSPTTPRRQMRLMFHKGYARWRPLLVTLLAHRASSSTLHVCLDALLRDSPQSEWEASLVLNFVQTLIDSPRIWQGRDKSTPKHYIPEDPLRLDHKQLEVLVRYVVEESEEANKVGGLDAMRRRIEARLPLLLRCCRQPHTLLSAALAASASTEHSILLPLLYMKVPKIQQLLLECEERPCTERPLAQVRATGDRQAVVMRSTSATDYVSHTLLTAVMDSSGATNNNSKERQQKLSRMEAGIRALWSRVAGAGARALPLAAALLRGWQRPTPGRHHHLLAALETLDETELANAPQAASEELYNILDCFLSMLSVASTSGRERDTALQHRVGALLRRYLAAEPQRATALLHAHKDTVTSIPALSSLSAVDVSAPASASPPPHALLTLQRRTDTPLDLHWALQEIETWGTRRGGSWGGQKSSQTIARAAAPLAASPHACVRNSALSLLAELLPSVTDPTPGLNAVLECLDSSQPEIAQSALDKMPDLVVAMQEHAEKLLMKVFELGVKSRQPVEQCISKCVAAINMQRAC